MATVYWVGPADKYTKKDPYTFHGFDFRKVMLDNAWRPFTVSETMISGASPSPHNPGVARDEYSGSFEIRFMNVEKGTVDSFSRYDGGRYFGTITGLDMTYAELMAASQTTDKSDDLALFARAFAGDDVLTAGGANDLLEGFAGNDVITGGRGADRLYGGVGADRFVFKNLRDSQADKIKRDVVYDFSRAERDKIDLSAIDANSKKGGNQAFKFIGKQGFHKKAGELRYEKVKGALSVSGDVNGDGKADFGLTIKGIASLSKGDFLL